MRPRPFRYSCPYCYQTISPTLQGDALSALERHVKDRHGDRIAKATPFKVALQVRAATDAVATGGKGSR